MIDVINKVRAYEVDGEDCTRGKDARPEICVVSHWNDPDMVIIQWHDGSGKTVTVSARDLKAAIANATNTSRH